MASTPSRRMMDVVVLNDTARPDGGAGFVALHSAIGLANRGHRVIFFSAVPVSNVYELPPGADRIEFVSTDQQQILADPNRLRAAIQGVWNLTARHKLRRILDGLDPAHTIVHLHSWSKALSSSVISCAIERGFQTVCTLHDFFLACPNGGFYDYRNQRICDLAPLSAGCMVTNCDARKYSHKLWRTMRQVVQQSMGRIPMGIRHFVTLSDLSERVLAPFLPPRAEIHRVRNPIDVARSRSVDAGANDAFVVVGRLSEEKGPELAARAAALAGVSVVFVGDGPLRSRVDRFPNASVTGWLERGEVFDRLRKARALVLPSLWYEASPLSVMEAAAVGIPAIVSDSCAARELVIDGKSGLHFRRGDVFDLAAKMRMLLNRNLAKRLGAVSYRAYWANPPTIARHTAEIEGVYERVLASEGTPSAGHAGSQT